MREMSMTGLCEFLDVTDVTLRKWVKTEGCPYIQQADKKAGRTWLFDSAAVVRWYADRAAKLAVERVGVSEDGVISTDEAKRRRWVALAISAELDTGEKLKEFVRVPVALRRFEHEAAKIRSALQNLPNAVAGHLAPCVRDLVKAKIMEAVSKTLDSFRVSVTDDDEVDE
jgi:phage terminase Nu1 subunit (DNA packaging protein)